MNIITKATFQSLKGSEKIKALNDVYAKRLKVVDDNIEDLFGDLFKEANIVRPGIT